MSLYRRRTSFVSNIFQKHISHYYSFSFSINFWPRLGWSVLLILFTSCYTDGYIPVSALLFLSVHSSWWLLCFGTFFICHWFYAFWFCDGSPTLCQCETRAVEWRRHAPLFSSVHFELNIEMDKHANNIRSIIPFPPILHNRPHRNSQPFLQ